MAVELDFGKLGFTPRGIWTGSYNDGEGYEILDAVSHNHDTWISKEDDNTDEPTANSSKWFRATDSGAAAYEAAKAASEATEAALAAVAAAELPAVALESDVRAIVTGYADDRTPHK